jgi:hypothetical protein
MPTWKHIIRTRFIMERPSEIEVPAFLIALQQEARCTTTDNSGFVPADVLSIRIAAGASKGSKEIQSVLYFALLLTFRRVATNPSLFDEEATSQGRSKPGKEPIAPKWWNEIRQILGSIELGSSSGRQVVIRLLSDPDALELVFEPYLDLEPGLAVQCALHNLLAN